MATVFETQTCSRCGGSGHYSRCERYGTTCFGCGGSTKQYTPRGKAALEFFRASMEKPASEIKVGDLVYLDNRFQKVLSVRQSDSYSVRQVAGVVTVRTFYTNIETAKTNYGVFPSTPVRTVRNEAHRQELLAAALVYQGTLNQKGKPMKRASKTV